MGFSLKAFFESALAIFDNGKLDDFETLEALEILIQDNYEYAQSCGLIK